MATLFISDLHLSQERPDKLIQFRSLLQGPAMKARGLYILGDLFEAWAGDDDMTPPHPEIINQLNEYTQKGGRLFFIRGNRDFLIGNRFTEKTGAILIDDPSVIDIYGTRTLLMHGDTLCTRDVSYQIYRRLVNNRFTITLFLSIPFTIRQRIWHGIRRMTKKSTRRKAQEIVDVSPSAVVNAMRNHNVRHLIHGHTHRQAIHSFGLDGETARRYVLGDWYDKDCVLVATKDNWRMLAIDDYIREQKADG